MYPLIWLFLLITLWSLFYQSVAGQSIVCNPTCATKTYCLSSNYTTNCSRTDCMVEVLITVIEREHFEEYLNFTLIGYKIKETQSRTIGLQLRKPNSNVIYSCSKSVSGLTSATVTQGTANAAIGSSIYLNGNLYCSWIMAKSDPAWPVDEGRKADLVTDHDYQISILADTRSVAVGENSSELPIYQMKFINCCTTAAISSISGYGDGEGQIGYKVRGNKEYLLIAKEKENSTDFLLQVIGKAPKVVKVALNNTDGLGIVSECDYATANLLGMATIGTVSSSISSQIENPRIYDHRCSWTLPRVVKSSYGTWDTKKETYKLQIISDGIAVYNQTNVRLNHALSTTIASVSLIFTAVIINFALC